MEAPRVGRLLTNGVRFIVRVVVIPRDILWFTMAWLTDMHPLMVSTGGIFLMNLRNFIKWAPEEAEEI